MRTESYPPRWALLSQFLRALAGRCEWCGAPNGAWVRRHKGNPAMWVTARSVSRDDAQWKKPVRIVLTVHHLGAPQPDGSPGNPHDKADCRPENLVCLCQRCHLLADLDIHMQNARRTRERKRRETDAEIGQMQLWE